MEWIDFRQAAILAVMYRQRAHMSNSQWKEMGRGLDETWEGQPSNPKLAQKIAKKIKATAIRESGKE